MNLLIEFLTAHGRYGAGEYHRRVVMAVLDRIAETNRDDIHIYALYDSQVTISFEDMREDVLGLKFGVEYLDLQEFSITKVIDLYKIDRFFIACGQRVGEYKEIENVKCETICVTHDLLYEEWFSNHLYEYWDSTRPHIKEKGIKGTEVWAILREGKHLLIHIKNCIFRRKSYSVGVDSLIYMKRVIKMLKNNPFSRCIMVSEYSKATMVYNFNIKPEKIEVLYSPARIESTIKPIENPILQQFISQGKKYYLMVSADRDSKNAIKAVHAFNQYKKFDDSAFLLITGYQGIPTNSILNLGFLSDSDLAQAMANCYALIYPSYFEGFGYPPLETMKFGKPVLCSNATSIPEIMGDAPIYFCPLYESAIFEALMKLTDSNYIIYSERSHKRYEEIRERQETDLGKLVRMIID